MDSAQQIALRYAGDDRLRRLCQTIVPVAGLPGRPPRPWPRPSCRPSARWPPCPPPIATSCSCRATGSRDDDPELPLTAIERDDLLCPLRVVRHPLCRAPARLGPSLHRPEVPASSSRCRASTSWARPDRGVRARANALKARSMLNAIDSLLVAHPGPDSDAGRRSGEALGERPGAREIRLLNVLRLAEGSPSRRRGGRTRTGHRRRRHSGRGSGRAWRRQRRTSRRRVGGARQMAVAGGEPVVRSGGEVDAARVVIRTCEGMMQT